jgi:hypothetical protein
MTSKLQTAEPRTGAGSVPGGTVRQANDPVAPCELHGRPQAAAEREARDPSEAIFLGETKSEPKAPDVGIVPLGSAGSRPEPPAPSVRPTSALPPNPYVEPPPPPSVHRVAEPHPAPFADEMPESWVRPRRAPRVAFRAGRVVAALYSLAGVAPLALGVGPRQFFWAAVAVISLTTYVTVAWFWAPLRAMMVTARLPLVPFLAVLFLTHAAGALAWSRALSRTVGDERFAPRDLPRWVRHPLCAGLGGLVLPGFGHVVTGHGRRAALAFWNAASVVLAALLLSHSNLLWNWNERSAADALPRLFVEAVLLASGCVLFVGGLLWIGAALDGVRLAVGHRAFAERPRLVGPGDAAAVGLLLALGAVALCMHPSRIAADLDSIAGAMRFSNYRLVPLTFESAATALDPARPEYSLRVAALYGDMGHPEKARAIHDRLRERWEAYARLVLENGTVPTASNPASAVPAPSAATDATPAGH